MVWGGGGERERLGRDGKNSKNLRSVMKSKPQQSQQSRLSTLQERTGVCAIKQRQVDHSQPPSSLPTAIATGVPRLSGAESEM